MELQRCGHVLYQNCFFCFFVCFFFNDPAPPEIYPLSLRDALPISFLFGISHHDAHVITASLNALRFLTIERLAHLTPQVLQGDTEGFGSRLNTQLHFLLTLAEGIGDLKHSGIFPKPTLDREADVQDKARATAEAFGFLPRFQATMRYLRKTFPQALRAGGGAAGGGGGRLGG